MEFTESREQSSEQGGDSREEKVEPPRKQDLSPWQIQERLDVEIEKEMLGKKGGHTTYQLTEYQQSVKMDKNSLLFVNNRQHARHTKSYKPPDDQQNHKDPMAVSIEDVYRVEVKGKFINEDQQSSLNNDYDYAMTQMFRIFLKTDVIYGKGPMKENHENKLHVT